MDTRLLLQWWTRAIGLACLCWFFVGCQHDPWADQFLKSQPAESDLVGTYRVDSDTLARPISIRIGTKTLSISQDERIVLSADHKAQFFHVPEVQESATRTCVVSSAGSWELGRNDEYFVINLKILLKDYLRSVDGCEETYYGQLMLYGKRPPYKFHITIGDPDSGDAIQFQRVK